jgi:hypothetical protein
MRLPTDIENLILNKCEPNEQVRLIHQNIMNIRIVKNPYLIVMTAIEMCKSDIAIKLIQYHTSKWDIEYYQEFFEFALRYWQGNQSLLQILYPIIEPTLPGHAFRNHLKHVSWSLLSIFTSTIGVGEIWEGNHIIDVKSISQEGY